MIQANGKCDGEQIKEVLDTHWSCVARCLEKHYFVELVDWTTKWTKTFSLDK